jgi:hypothetical protein
MVGAARVDATDRKRVCVACSAVLSRYNQDSLCAPCQERQRREQLAADFATEAGEPIRAKHRERATRVTVGASGRPEHPDVVNQILRGLEREALSSKVAPGDPHPRATQGVCLGCQRVFDPVPSGRGRPRTYCDATCRRRARYLRRYEKETAYQRAYWGLRGSYLRRMRRALTSGGTISSGAA